MRCLIALAALTTLAACGVDGPPTPPAKDSALAPAKNATPQTGSSDWMGGTVRMHTATTL